MQFPQLATQCIDSRDVLAALCLCLLDLTALFQFGRFLEKLGSKLLDGDLFGTQHCTEKFGGFIELRSDRVDLAQ